MDTSMNVNSTNNINTYIENDENRETLSENNVNNTNNPNHVEEVNGYILDVLLEVIAIFYEKFSENMIEIFYTESEKARKLEENEEFVLITIEKIGFEIYGYFEMRYFKKISFEKKPVFFVQESPLLIQYGIMRKERKVSMVKSVSKKFLFHVEEEMKRKKRRSLYLIAKPLLRVKDEKEF
jgi:hypothetical protein